MSVKGSTGPAKSRSTPPGPISMLRSTIAFQRSPLDYIGGLIKTYGDVLTFRLPTSRIVVLRHPHHVKHVLQQRAGNYPRDTAAHKMARNMFGNGLATISGGPQWRRQRRLVQPSFHYQRVAAMSEHMLAVIGDTLQRWQRLAAEGEILETNKEMRQLTLRVVAKALFSLDEEERVARFARAVDRMDHELSAYMRFPLVPLSVPTASHRRFWASLRKVSDVITYVIDRQRADPVDRGDLLSLLMETRDDETGERMSDEQLRDEIFVMLFAGHETSANVLTWVLYRLARHVDVQKRVQQELARELEGRDPTLADCTKLVFTRCVIDETMRLYPQQWQGWRSTAEDDEIGGYRIPAGTDIFFSTYHVHRHPEFWDEPEAFRPERFLPEQAAKRDRSAYLPFGSGPHLCVGNQFALTEMLLLLAGLLRRFDVTLAEDVTVAPKPLVTLGPEREIPIRLLPRS
ncbi:cytochrome P450 [Saccharomonospora amisosensis]|uniref:Cytochrome P450 n=1 Tax=Saccharomonospora amisosensis TaxID=1128677 RepID=A0A7X5UQG0_9PSEU|nr:cytochrome P450 [Saccharomonospora amisosensis]NIJ12007.1 cytochrome P450 [Saccharomonospora amisosensis]